jgi:uncharacterized membrane protein YdjX (TVP38/TMEM64 family)
MAELPPQTATGVTDAPRPRRRGVWPRVALVAGVAAAVAAFYATGLREGLTRDELLRHLGEYRSKVAENPGLSLLIFFAAYVAVTALSLPVAAWLSLLAGALFGRWLGTGVVILAATLGATLAFLSSRYLIGDYLQRRFAGPLAAFNRGVEREGAYYLFTLRLIPAFPFWLINLGMGLTPMRVLTFAAVSLVAMLPGTFLYVNAGTALASIESPRDVVSLPVLGSLALLGVLPLVLRKVVTYSRRGAKKGSGVDSAL